MDRQPDSCLGEVNAVTKNGPGSAYAVECGPRRMRILGSPNRRLRLDGPRTLAAVKKPGAEKDGRRPAAEMLSPPTAAGSADPPALCPVGGDTRKNQPGTA